MSGGRANAAGQQRCLGTGNGVGSALGGPLEHPADQPDVERFGFGGAGAGGLDPFRSPLLDQAEQGVDLAHLGPRQRGVQHAAA